MSCITSLAFMPYGNQVLKYLMLSPNFSLFLEVRNLQCLPFLFCKICR